MYGGGRPSTAGGSPAAETAGAPGGEAVVTLAEPYLASRVARIRATWSLGMGLGRVKEG